MSEPRVVAIVQARMGSSRLPGKVLAKAAGKTLLEHLVERLRVAKTLQTIVIATTNLGVDDPIVAEASRLGIACFRGDEDDVLGRFEGAAEAFPAEVIVRITADCPLLDPAEVDAVVKAFLSANPPVDYAANLAPHTRKIPLGMSVEVMSRKALRRAFVEGHDRHHREHVTPYLYEAPSRFATLVVHPERDLSYLRLTVDTPEDFSVVSEVLEAIATEPDRLSSAMAPILRFFEARPEVALRNAGVKQKSFDETAPAPRVPDLLMLVRVDATAEIGAGHAMRCFAIAEAWIKAGGRVVCRGTLPPTIAARYEAAGAKMDALPEGLRRGSAEDGQLVAAKAEQDAASVILLDGYAFDAAYLAGLRHRARVVAYVDDFVQHDLPVDVVIDPNAGAPLGGRGQGVTVCAGSAFTPLRDEIASAKRPTRAFTHEPRSLLLTFGASDPARLSVPALRAAIAVATRLPLAVTVLAGAMHPDVATLEALAASKGVTLVRDAKAVAPLFAAADFAFAAAGSTCWELCAMGVPMLLVAVADNQNVVIEPIVKAGAARLFALADASDQARIEAAIESFVRQEASVLQTMSEAARHLVDGKGADRITRTLSVMAIQRGDRMGEKAKESA